MKQQTTKLPITKKQLAILILLYQFRFLDTTTIQLLLNHKIPTRIQQWLKDLTSKGYIHQFYDRTSFVERTKPAVYCLTTKARQILKEQRKCKLPVLNQIYREIDRSEEFREHCCYVAKIYLQLRDQYGETKGNGEIKFFTKVELTGYDYFPKPFPDGYFVIKQKGKHIRRYLLEVLDLDIPKRVLKERIRRYIASEQGDWNEMTNNLKFPTVLFILRNKHKQRSIKKLIQKVRDEEFSYLPCYLTNKEAIKEQGLENIIWEKVKEREY
jgi:hypothetical protein